MSRRYILSPEASQDLDEIKAYLLAKADLRVARYVLRQLREGLEFLAVTPDAGHVREDLTDQAVKFWPVFSYPIVYDSMKRPLEVVRVLHLEARGYRHPGSGRRRVRVTIIRGPLVETWPAESRTSEVMKKDAHS